MPRNSNQLPKNYDELLQEAIQLKRGILSRSVETIITLLELENRVAPGILKRSIRKRHLFEAGFGSTRLKVYKGPLDELVLESRFYRSDAKRQLKKEIEILRDEQGMKVVCVLDEAHRLEKETIEEFRFLLNYRFESMNPMALILAW